MLLQVAQFGSHACRELLTKAIATEHANEHPIFIFAIRRSPSGFVPRDDFAPFGFLLLDVCFVQCLSRGFFIPGVYRFTETVE